MRPRTGIAAFVTVLSAAGLLGAATAASASTAAPATRRGHLIPGDLLVSESYYTNDPNLVKNTTQLPPGLHHRLRDRGGRTELPVRVQQRLRWTAASGSPPRFTCGEIPPIGPAQDVIPVPSSELNTSFSSKSEGALNLSTDGKYVTFIDYAAAPDTVDVSNANTPGVIDPTNPVPGAYYRAVAQLSADGKFTFTETNAYSGNNGRAAVVAKINGKYDIYTAGNAGNGGNPQPSGVVLGAGAQIITPSNLPESEQNPGQPTPVGSFNVTELGDKADKVGKDDNFRGLALYNNVLYYTKGSGGNGVDTVYFLDTTGKACPNGVGLPGAGAPLPTTEHRLPPTPRRGLAQQHVHPEGLPDRARQDRDGRQRLPVRDLVRQPDHALPRRRGCRRQHLRATRTYTAAAASTTAGLQKWVYNATAASGSSPTRCRTGSTSACRTPCRGYPTGLNTARRDRTALGAGHRRPAQHHRPGQPQRHRDDLGGHLDRQRRRRPGRRPEQAGGDHRRARRHLAAGRREVRTVVPAATTRSCAACRSPRARIAVSD